MRSPLYSLGSLGVDGSSDVVYLDLGHVLRPAVRGGDDVALHLGQLLLLLLQADFSGELIVIWKVNIIIHESEISFSQGQQGYSYRILTLLNDAIKQSKH